MLLEKLLESFDAYTKLHVEVDCVADQIKDFGIQDEIRFHFVSMDEGTLRGLVYRYTKHKAVYGDPIYCSEICIAKTLTPDWRRLVAVKELLHITDTPAETAQSEAAVDALVERMALPSDIREDTRSSFNDETRILPALAVLVPKECRKILRNLIESEKITSADAAEMAQIPERYIELVLSDLFEELIERLLMVSRP